MTAKDWFAPGAIRFKVKGTLWLLQNLESLRAGHWPPEASNYIDIPGTKSGKAPFITAAEFYVEITDRLEKCGIDGLILLAMECWGESPSSLAKYLKMPEFSIVKRRKSALGYVASGPARRWHNSRKRAAESYKDFKRRKAKPPSPNLGGLTGE